jgi:hypothetical protein
VVIGDRPHRTLRSGESDDAFVTVQLSPGFSPRRYSTMGILFTREYGQWKMIDGTVIALNFNDCKQLQLRDGRDFLVCSLPDGDQSGQRNQIQMVRAKQDGIELKLLFEARDNTMICDSDRFLEKAVVHHVEFVDLNRDGDSDISILASYGKNIQYSTTRTTVRDSRPSATGRALSRAGQ